MNGRDLGRPPSSPASCARQSALKIQRHPDCGGESSTLSGPGLLMRDLGVPTRDGCNFFAVVATAIDAPRDEDLPNDPSLQVDVARAEADCARKCSRLQVARSAGGNKADPRDPGAQVATASRWQLSGRCYQRQARPSWRHRLGYRPGTRVTTRGSGTSFRDGLTWVDAVGGGGPGNGRFRNGRHRRLSGETRSPADWCAAPVSCGRKTGLVVLSGSAACASSY
jgi:hypothetical protein